MVSDNGEEEAMRGMRRLSGVCLAMAGFGVGVQPASGQMMMNHEPVVSAEWLDGHLEDEHVVILHATRSRATYEEGHLPGARFLDLSKLAWDGDPAWGTEITAPEQIREALEEAGVRDEHHHLVVYSESPLLAARAFMTLEVMGLQGRVTVLDGGLSVWREEGLPVSTESPSYERGSIELRPRSDVVVGADWIHERLDDPSIALVDARPDDEYTGADGGMGGRTNPGHIPGAAQLYWEELIEGRAEPRLRDRTELRALFEAAGADEGDTVVTYCMVGLRASFTYLTARLLGYDTKFYDGSWHDWGTREDLPYVTGSERR